MRIATWNVNSLKARLPRVEAWLEECQPDILCMQETKLADANFPALTFGALGYDSAHHGEGQWNGVAILSRVGIKNVTNGFDDAHVDPEVLELRSRHLLAEEIAHPEGRMLHRLRVLETAC